MITNPFNLDKMSTSLIDGLAHYQIQTGEELVEMNALIGKPLKIHYLKEINCTHCQKKTNKSYSGGYCYVCSIKLAQCDMCILKPELCHFEAGSCREPEWGKTHCMVDHYVYLANSSGLKVGITRATQLPTRWIDQGAVSGLPVLKVSTRYQSGVFEALLKEELNDKTDWRKMLKGDADFIDLESKRDEIYELFGDDLDSLESKFGAGSIEVLETSQTTEIKFPVLEYPTKVTSMGLDKNEVVGGKLLGIKGQYLIFDVGVINIRGHTGYKVYLEY